MSSYFEQIIQKDKPHKNNLVFTYIFYDITETKITPIMNECFIFFPFSLVFLYRFFIKIVHAGTKTVKKTYTQARCKNLSLRSLITI